MNSFDIKTMEKKTRVLWLGSAVVTAVCLVAVVLFAGGTLPLSLNARTALGLVLTVALIVFAYTTCKHLGVLKGQKRP